ncbi:dynein regulatory complex protein 10-like [Arctopsyche grandis]|uniref:dynein regulatory complex protein 10-like n=1 Tax=Arctopsyche grandis TaxID=121162 RepID=UPI00406D71B7
MDSMSDVSTLSTDTGSNISRISFNFNNNERDIKEYSAVDLEIQIQNERITSILRETIFKTEIVIFLTQANQNSINILRDTVSEDDFQIIERFRFEQSVSGLDMDQGDYETITKDQIHQIFIDPGSKVIPVLSHIIWMIIGYSKLKPIIKKTIENVSEIFYKYENSNSSNVIPYLNALVKLKTKMREKLMLTAAEKLKRDVLMRNLYKTNKAVKLKIADATKKLNNIKENFEKEFNEKEGVIKRQQEQLDLLKNNCKAEISRIILETEYEMKLTEECHEDKLSILKEKDAESAEHYECLLRENLDMENELKKIRRNVENDLQDWLDQYDRDVGSKQATLDHLSECYEREKQQLAELQVKFDMQEETYIPLMAQKEEEYQKEVLHKMTTFLMEHAARVIQRAWRKIMAARAEKKRLKKLASKKKKVKDSSVSIIQV